MEQRIRTHVLADTLRAHTRVDRRVKLLLLHEVFLYGKFRYRLLSNFPVETHYTNPSRTTLRVAQPCGIDYSVRSALDCLKGN